METDEKKFVWNWKVISIIIMVVFVVGVILCGFLSYKQGIEVGKNEGSIQTIKVLTEIVDTKGSISWQDVVTGESYVCVNTKIVKTEGGEN
jgi:hypothetical protein